MRKLFGVIITIFYVMFIPAQAQAATKGTVTKAAHPAKTGATYRSCRGCPQMVAIYPGSFDMGSPDSEAGRGDDEGPVHSVKITAYSIGKNEVTRGEFAEFVKKTRYSTGDKCWTLENGKYEEHKGNWREPGFPQSDLDPVVCINWNDTQAYAKWLSHRTGKKYRLPTEAEWEYAARGGTGTARYWGNNPDDACAYANGADKTAQAKIGGATSWSVHHCTDDFAYTAPVGHFKPNAFGLNDMLGNVWEWTGDIYHANYKGAPTDGSAWQGSGEKRLLRGGSWNNSPADLRAAVRYKSDPGLRFSSFGFRVVRSYK
jgi:formylglycine-generating enzyme required for sulfatase activity